MSIAGQVNEETVLQYLPESSPEPVLEVRDSSANKPSSAVAGFHSIDTLPPHRSGRSASCQKFQAAGETPRSVFCRETMQNQYVARNWRNCPEWFGIDIADRG